MKITTVSKLKKLQPHLNTCPLMCIKLGVNHPSISCTGSPRKMLSQRRSTPCQLQRTYNYKQTTEPLTQQHLKPKTSTTTADPDQHHQLPTIENRTKIHGTFVLHANVTFGHPSFELKYPNHINNDGTPR